MMPSEKNSKNKPRVLNQFCVPEHARVFLLALNYRA